MLKYTESKIPISPADAGPIPPGGGPGAISPKARGSIRPTDVRQIGFGASDPAPAAPRAGTVIPTPKTPIPSVRGGATFDKNLEENLVLIDYNDLTSTDKDRKAFIETLLKFKKKIIAFTIISGILVLLFNNRKSAKKFLRKLIKFLLKLNRSINGLINRNRFTKSLHAILKILLKSPKPVHF